MAHEVYDADQRALEREAAGLKLDGKVYRRRRRTNSVMRAVKRFSREQDKLNDQIDELTRSSHVERLETRLDDLQARVTKAQDEAERDAATEALHAQRPAILEEIEAERAKRGDEDEIERLQDEAEGKIFEMIALLLGPTEENETISAEQLAESLDFEDALRLSRSLSDIQTGDEDAKGEPDPT